MALKQGDRDNFRTLLRAALNGDLALIETTDAKTGEYRAILAAIAFDGTTYNVTPFGHLCTGNPFEDYTDPVVNIHTADKAPPLMIERAVPTSGRRTDDAGKIGRPYIEILAADIRTPHLRAFGRVWLQGTDIPKLLPRDIGKRLVKVGDSVQMENEEQFAARLRARGKGETMKPNQVWVKQSGEWHCVFDSHSPLDARYFAWNHVAHSGNVERVEVRDLTGPLVTVFDWSWDKGETRG